LDSVAPAMAIGIITGSGTHTLPGFTDARAEDVQTPFGSAEVVRGRFAGHEVLHLSRHGAGHARLSHQVTHRANVWALRELGADAVIGCTACGAVDPSLALGSLIVFDDLWFASNRLPDGSLCTFFAEEGDRARGHWVLHGGPFSEGLRAGLVAGAAVGGQPARDGGVYGHVDGPRFNTPVEIAQLAGAGVTAVSQTGGPETVLCGELELPYALIGFVTDYANEVIPGEPTPVETLSELMGASSGAFATMLEGAVRWLAEPGRLGALEPGGTMFRLQRD
jgi:purine nucleoside phosphorylase